MSECLWPPLALPSKRTSYESAPSTTLARIAFTTTTTMQEPTNISIEAGCRQPRNSPSNERLTPSLARVTIGTPPRDFPVLDQDPKENKTTTSKRVDGLQKMMAGGKVISPEEQGSIDTRHVQANAKSSSSISVGESTVDSITVPVMRLSIADALSQDSDDSDPLTAASFREAYSTAEAVTTFLDQQLRAQHDSYGYGAGGPPEGTASPFRRPGRMFQRRNSFVIHNRKRSRSLEEGRDSSAGAEELPTAAAAQKPRFDTRSQSEGVLLMGGQPATTSQLESPFGLHRLSFPWKPKKGENSSHAAAGPAASSKHG